MFQIDLGGSIAKCYQIISSYLISVAYMYTCINTLRYYPQNCVMGRVNYMTVLWSHSQYSVDAHKCFLLGCIENKTLLVFPGVEQDHYTSVKKKTQIILVPLHGRKKIQVASSHKPSLFKLHAQITLPRIQNHSPLGLVKKKFPLWKGICLQKGVVFTCGQYNEAWISKLWICNNLSIFYSEAAIFMAHVRLFDVF